jgi:hypothetical protein
MVELRVVSRSKLESGQIAVTVVPVDKSAVNANGWGVRDTVTLVLPAEHEIHALNEYKDQVGYNQQKGEPIYKSRFEPKSSHEWSDHDTLALIADLSQRIWVLERFCKQLAMPEGVLKEG